MSKISISAYRMYHTCPRKYKFYYIDRLRSERKSTALLFGLAMDKALNDLLLKKTNDPVSVFQENFTLDMLNGALIGKYDIDYDIIPEERLEEFLSKDDTFKAWASLRIKGRLLIEEYQRVVMKLINKVITVQDELTDRPGFIDVIADLRGEGVVLLDHKTSNTAYKDDAVKEDLQLALYSMNKNIKRAGFIVLIKNLEKNVTKVCKKCAKVIDRSVKTCDNTIKSSRCGGEIEITKEFRPKIQILIDDVPEEIKLALKEDLNETEDMISKNIFPRILQSCKQFYGGSCEYYNACWRNDFSGLTKKEKE